MWSCVGWLALWVSQCSAYVGPSAGSARFGARRFAEPSGVAGVAGNAPVGFAALRLRALEQSAVERDRRRAPFFARATAKTAGGDSSEVELRRSLERASSDVLRHGALRVSDAAPLRGRLSLLRAAAASSGDVDVAAYVDALDEIVVGGSVTTAGARRSGGVYADAIARVGAEMSAALREADFCLSLSDRGGSGESVTRELNTLSNDLLRAASYGDVDDVEALRMSLAARRESFESRWRSAEATAYFDALATLTRSSEQSAVRDASFATFFLNGAAEIDPSGAALSARLGDAYSVALQRFLGELTRRGAIAGASPSAVAAAESLVAWDAEQVSDEAAASFGQVRPLGFNFIEWEMRLRRELAFRRTSEAAALQPNDFVGRWRVLLVDDQSPLAPQPLELAMNGAVDEGEDAAIEVVFLADGHISCTQLDEELASKNKAAVKKPRWRVRPGPAHLDTCEFEFDVAGAGRVAFCGYVDRGQRIESRFSRRPIRVSGFAFEKRDAADASNTADDSRPSGRFAMSGPVDVRSSKWF